MSPATLITASSVCRSLYFSTNVLILFLLICVCWGLSCHCKYMLPLSVCPQLSCRSCWWGHQRLGQCTSIWLFGPWAWESAKLTVPVSVLPFSSAVLSSCSLAGFLCFCPEAVWPSNFCYIIVMIFSGSWSHCYMCPFWCQIAQFLTSCHWGLVSSGSFTRTVSLGTFPLSLVTWRQVHISNMWIAHTVG
jgi:hypothetical protein